MQEPDVTAATKPELTPEAILGSLQEIALESLELPPETVASIKLETPLLGGLNLDSLAQTVLLAEVEERFRIAFEMEDREALMEAKTIQDLVNVILKRATAEDSPE